jgi:hypothetical protein
LREQDAYTPRLRSIIRMFQIELPISRCIPLYCSGVLRNRTAFGAFNSLTTWTINLLS